MQQQADYGNIIEEIFGAQAGSPTSERAKARLQIGLTRELTATIQNLIQAFNASTREAETLNRRVIWLNVFLVVLTAVLVGLSIVLVFLGFHPPNST